MGPSTTIGALMASQRPEPPFVETQPAKLVGRTLKIAGLLKGDLVAEPQSPAGVGEAEVYIASMQTEGREK